MHILSPETDNCPSWISGRERMTEKIFHDQSPWKNVAETQQGSNSWPPDLQSERIQLCHRGRLGLVYWSDVKNRFSNKTVYWYASLNLVTKGIFFWLHKDIYIADIVIRSTSMRQGNHEYSSLTIQVSMENRKYIRIIKFKRMVLPLTCSSSK